MLLLDKDLIWHLAEGVFANLREGHEALTGICGQDVAFLNHSVLAARPSYKTHHSVARVAQADELRCQRAGRCDVGEFECLNALKVSHTIDKVVTDQARLVLSHVAEEYREGGHGLNRFSVRSHLHKFSRIVLPVLEDV